MKKIILKLLGQIIYMFSEKTAPNVKYSEKNHKVAEATLAIQALTKLF
mgnify:CR=1 FL=1